MKKYIANSDISVSVTLPNKKSIRISFSSLSNGTSVFYTSDNDIQWALERHYKFGKLFRLAEDVPDKKMVEPKKPTFKNPAKKKVKSAESEATGNADKNTEKSAEGTAMPKDKVCDEIFDMTVETDVENADSDNNNADEDDTTKHMEVAVSDMDAAKDYLAENFDVVRTKLKNEKIISETAAAYGIIFKYYL